jgi:phage tail-like protein
LRLSDQLLTFDEGVQVSSGLFELFVAGLPLGVELDSALAAAVASRSVVEGPRPGDDDEGEDGAGELARISTLEPKLGRGLREEPESAFDVGLQEVADLLLAEGDRYAAIFDLERAPEPFLDLIVQDLGNPFPFDLDVLGKRRLASVLVEMYRQKGTAVGIENAIRFFLGIDVAAITPFAGTTLVLGESELGVDWELGPSNRFARYAFNVEVEVPLTDTERHQIRAIVDYLKPAHTHFVDLIEPGLPPVFDHWELGISELGWTTDLH